MSYLGDFAKGDTIDLYFTTVNASGVPTTLSGTPAASVYKNNSTTQSTSGVTLTTDFDGVTGLNQVRITTNSDGTFYDVDGSFSVVLTTGTVGGSSVVGYVVGSFSLENRKGIVDKLLKRDLSALAGEAARSLLNAVRFLRNKWSLSGTTLTVYKEDDTTSAWTATVTNSAGADPITGSDPS